MKRAIRQNLGLKAPKGYGWITNPKKAAYNKVYNKTSFGCMVFVGVLVVGVGIGFGAAVIINIA